MFVLIRVDDRLVHGQITTSWVPNLKAGALLVVSDEIVASRLKTDAIACCAYKGLAIVIKSVADTIEGVKNDSFTETKTILIVASLGDALRLYDGGFEFASLNVGNIHHAIGQCRDLTPSICIDAADEEILERFVDLGVKIDLRDVPTSKPGSFEKRG